MSTKEPIKSLAQNTFKNHLDFLSSGQIEKWVDLFSEEGVLEFPYGPADFPKLVQGKTELYDYMKNFPKHFKVDFENLHFYATEDPTLVIAEFTSTGTAISTGKPYNQKYISVVHTNEEGKILKYVDFWNPMVALEAMNAPLSNFVQ
ncbi:nuclear transport factor 2 family protein [Chryseobacterium fluminis]|uniref:nuclear transport factor 2 family protein n=1 Tax=Chryseobacterium fluminis TaxID=2983606 RepID=UPI00225BD8F9|nr:nuclear transport factor 2 family protein [Chryseobacterium sp. MMS21-Ot14]UZT99198.1 nuclear transport factor 2 family protein [Chryseobacterium sp. MMS21-Ot14]